MSSLPRASFSSLPTEVRLHVFQLAARPDSEPKNHAFFFGVRDYFDDFEYLCDLHQCQHDPPCAGYKKRSIFRGLFSHQIWAITDPECLEWYNESTVYKTRHALLHTCRLGREVALLEWMWFIKGLNGGIDGVHEPLKKEMLDALGSLLAQVQEGKAVQHAE